MGDYAREGCEFKLTGVVACIFRIFSYRRDVIAVLAVKARPLRGRFASLDRSARRWLLLAMSFW